MKKILTIVSIILTLCNVFQIGSVQAAYIRGPYQYDPDGLFIQKHPEKRPPEAPKENPPQLPPELEPDQRPPEPKPPEKPKEQPPNLKPAPYKSGLHIQFLTENLTQTFMAVVYTILHNQIPTIFVR